MCGIVGYIGSKPALQPLLSGLKRLEYRGYDSAGVALASEVGMTISRSIGPVHELQKQCRPSQATSGIAHTRWATHGQPSERNAHPHTDFSGNIAVVHNGIIENHAAIRQYLVSEGITFKSETDTEALVQLIGFLYRNMDKNTVSDALLSAVCGALREVKGTFGIAVLYRLFFSPCLKDFTTTS